MIVCGSLSNLNKSVAQLRGVLLLTDFVKKNLLKACADKEGIEIFKCLMFSSRWHSTKKKYRPTKQNVTANTVQVSKTTKRYKAISQHTRK